MKKASALVLMLLFLVACKTYYITPESLREQMTGIDSTHLKDVKVNNPLGFNNIAYEANQIEFIKCVDKNGQNVFLKNSPSIEMRVTQKNGKRTIFYFDRTIIQNDILIGGQSRFINSVIKEIPLCNISLIEIQDGGKNFNYK